MVAIAAPHWVAGLLTSSPAAQSSAAQLLPWLVPAAAAQVYAGVGASALAAFDDYGTAALGYALGAASGLAVIGALVHRGVAAFGWGLAVNGAIAVGVPLAALLAKGGIARPGRAVGHRLRDPRRGGIASLRAPGALHHRLPVRERARRREPDDLLVRLSHRLAARGGHRHLDRARLLGAALPRRAHRRARVGPRRRRRPGSRSRSSRLPPGCSLSPGSPSRRRRSDRATAAARAPSSGDSSPTWRPGWSCRSRSRSPSPSCSSAAGRAGCRCSRWRRSRRTCRSSGLGSSAWGLGGMAAGLALTTAGVLAVLLAALGALRSASRGVVVAALSCGIPALAGFGAASFMPVGDRSGRARPAPLLRRARRLAPGRAPDRVGLPSPVRLSGVVAAVVLSWNRREDTLGLPSVAGGGRSRAARHRRRQRLDRRHLGGGPSRVPRRWS